MPFNQAGNPVSRFPQNNFTSQSEAAHHPGVPYLNQSQQIYQQHSTAEGGQKPARVTLQPISETKQRVMSNPSRAARGGPVSITHELYDMHGGQVHHEGGGGQMMQMPYQQNTSIQTSYLN